MNRRIRNIIFVAVSFAFYLLWNYGGEQVYGKVVTRGIEQFVTKISDIETVDMKTYEEENETMLSFNYPDRTTRITLEYCLPIVLLLAWQFALFFDKRITTKKAAKLFAFNFLIIYFLQLIFPLLLFNVSQSGAKSIGLFIGMQIFGFLVFFLILKDSLIIRLSDNLKHEQ